MKGGFFIPIRSIVLASEGSSATIALKINPKVTTCKVSGNSICSTICIVKN
jgi:hypothetical protein